jgi:hypothetical protein
MKKTNAMLAILAPSIIILSMTACQKEFVYPKAAEEEFVTTSSRGPVTRAYRDSAEGDITFVPDFANGWTYPNAAPAWYHGFAEGNATHIGNIDGYFNHYGLQNAAGILMAYNRPVTMFYATELQPYNPSSNVDAVIFDDKGNSIWFQIPPEGWTTEPMSATRINFYGTHLIVGGTGKFEGASGETFIQGYFNPQNLQELTFWRNGWIAY